MSATDTTAEGRDFGARDEIDAVERMLPEGALAVQGQPGAPTVPEGPGALLSVMLELARDPNFNAANLQVLSDMQARMEERQAIRLFGEALSRIQAKVPKIPKNGVVSLGKNKNGEEQSYDFAKWEDMDAVVSPFLREEGFAVTFSEETSDQNGIRWSASWRAFGHIEKNFITLPADTGAGRNPLQARGSTNSYAKRYLTEDFLKLVRAGADDDGVRGGTKFITNEEEAELISLCEQAGRDEVSLVERMFQGRIHHFNEIEQGQGFLLIRSTLEQIIHQRAAKGP